MAWGKRSATRSLRRVWSMAWGGFALDCCTVTGRAPGPPARSPARAHVAQLLRTLAVEHGLHDGESVTETADRRGHSVRAGPE